MSMVLEKVLLNRKGKKLNCSYKHHPQKLWKLYQEHQPSSTAAQGIAINLSNKLSSLSIAKSKSRSDFLEEFDSTSEKYDLISVDKMPSSHKIGLLKKAVLADNSLLQAWTAVEQIFANKSSGTVTTYEECWNYKVSVAEKLEEGLVENVNWKVSIADTYYMDSIHLETHITKKLLI